MQSTGSSIYEGAAELGKAKSAISFWIGSVVGIVLILIGLYMISRKTEEYNKINAKILSIDNCVHSSNKDSNSRTNESDECVLKLEFSVGDKKYNPTLNQRYINNELSAAKTNQNIDVYYKVANPIDITLTDPKLIKICGVILIILGMLIFGGVYFNKNLVNKNKSYAAYSGAQTVSSGLLNIFK